jgi:hypothetical protein
MMRALAIGLLLFAPASVSDLVQETIDSGRVIGLPDSPSGRVAPGPLVYPGAPPVLTFRYFDAADRGRFGNLGLMTDDAGH